MDSQSQPTVSIVPSVALVINTTSHEGVANPANLDAVVSMLRKTAVPTTWIVGDAPQAKLLASKVDSCEIATTVAARSPQRLRTELANLQASVQAVNGQQVTTVVGDPQQLRSRAALLANLGVAAIVSAPSSAAPTQAARQLPCGLWQLQPSVSLPRPSGRWSLLPRRRPSLAQLVGERRLGVAALDLSLASPRDLRHFATLLDEIGQASRSQKLKVSTVSEIAAQLTQQSEVKPQRSILRRAA